MSCTFGNLNVMAPLLIFQMDLVAAEIESLQSLQHPHIVDYLGTEKEDNMLRIFLEYVVNMLLPMRQDN